ncbi:hypothetical protein E4188_23885 (plasmid) [Aeromonas media]|uniref:Uncharacterized protein n=2 Tax=Aeromonas TaxID=642 RepID=A0ABX6NYT7_AERME|nr:MULTISPECIES: hypothetical protein [Aeromonas]ASI21438.1 hypothetical protein CE456_00915 [Aeromonas salmonicida]QJT41533.1 hypothetical protein E4188_23885 [Aeromonas media]QLI59066.1 hypothetical protein C0708_23245 [Aeromonas caviae]QLI60294.1 hypothetical protein C1C91_22895 [Aeromonas caviae]HDN9373737.1 hypothetical protein [Aeromonas salmonicida]
MGTIRTTLPHGSKQKEVLKRWRVEYPAKFERIFENGDLITRVASDEADIAWGECIAAALIDEVKDIPRKWVCIIASDRAYRCVLWEAGDIRRDEVVDATELSEWLQVHPSDRIFATTELPVHGLETTIIEALNLRPDDFELIEFRGSALARMVKPSLVCVAGIAAVTWFLWPEPPPPPPPEVTDPWYAYRAAWTDVQLAGDAISELGVTCAKFGTIPVVTDLPAGTIEPGSINMVLSEVVIDRKVINAWSDKNNLAMSFSGSLPFIRVAVPLSSYWSSHYASFKELDDKVFDLFSKLSLISGLKASYEPIEANGVWASRKANLNITKANPWFINELGNAMKGMPIKLESATFSISKEGDCTLNNAVILFGGGAQ